MIRFCFVFSRVEFPCSSGSVFAALRCLILRLAVKLLVRGCDETTCVVQVVTHISPGSVIALGGNARIWSEGPLVYADNMSRSRCSIKNGSHSMQRQPVVKDA